MQYQIPPAALHEPKPKRPEEDYWGDDSYKNSIVGTAHSWISEMPPPVTRREKAKGVADVDQGFYEGSHHITDVVHDKGNLWHKAIERRSPNMIVTVQ